ncbi:NAD(P)-binding domain-containing protein [Streptomyces sp. NPDC026672]|uniref:NADPH-dependent F420 reductase n=1 Tax=unclassified Streptomyces TaxID=2593676 RepID=UPI00340C7895
MQVGFIGAGAVANAIASQLTSAGHSVTLSNRRGPDSLRDQVAALGPLARAGTKEEAAAAQMVFLSVMWSDIDAALEGLPDWDGRILVDTTNQFEQVDGHYTPVDTRTGFGVETGSEVVAQKTPGARVIKAFNTLFAPDLSRFPRHDGGRRVLFHCGDDPDAKSSFTGVVDEVGWFPVDLGSLRNGGRLMQVGTGPLPGLHLLTQHAEPTPPATRRTAERVRLAEREES